MIKSLNIILSIVFLLLTIIICSGQNKNLNKPNVLFIAVDDLNDWTGYIGGHPQAKTPNIDRLAKKGVAFTHAYASAPLCNPSRVSLLTSILPSNSGVYGNAEAKFRKKIPDAVTLMQYFKLYGYKTMGAGKIFHGFNNPGDDQSWDYYHRINRNPNLIQTKNGKIKSKFNGRDIELPHPSLFNWGPIDIEDEEMPDVKVANWAISELNKKHEKPFFLAFGFTKPHLPWYVPRKYFEKFPLDEIILPETIAADIDDLPPFGKKLAREIYIPSTGKNFNVSGDVEHKQIISANQWKKGVQAYLATINFADVYLGAVLDALADSQYAQNTIVVLWGDHGWHLGEKEHWRKHALWEDTTRTPLVIYYPDVIKNATSISHPISLLDIYPTLVEMCGLPTKENIDGKSFYELLKHPNQSWDRPVLMTLGKGNHAVRTKRWRYIQYFDGTNELYDHNVDPNEWKNLSGLTKYNDVIETLKKSLPKTKKNQSYSHSINPK